MGWHHRNEVFENYALVIQLLSRVQVRALQPTVLSSPLSPGVCSNSCPLSQWCHPTISSSVTLFSSCPQSFPSSGSFPMSWLFPPGGQSIEASVSVSVLPMNIQGWFPLGLIGLISLQSEGLSRVFLSSTNWCHSLKASILWSSAFFMDQLSQLYMTTGKPCFYYIIMATWNSPCWRFKRRLFLASMDHHL